MNVRMLALDPAIETLRSGQRLGISRTRSSHDVNDALHLLRMQCYFTRTTLERAASP